MIKRIQSSEDIAGAVELLQLFLQESTYEQYVELQNRQHLSKLIHAIMLSHFAWIAEINNRPVGLLLALKERNIWIPGLTQLRELVWYVRPEHRTSGIGGRLFLEYCRQAEELMESNVIQGYFTTRMDNTQAINLERRGFRMVEQTYLKEQ
jgi:GNAT superfamily N-acetyltransferase